MKLKMKITNVKCIKNLEFEFPLEQGIYAITGENGSGKSTLISCASTVFFHLSMTDYFGKPENAIIEFSIGNAIRKWTCDCKQWKSTSSVEKMKLNGFYEGSIMFGNRFKDTNFSVIKILDNMKESDLKIASEFVRKNLGVILHDDSNYFKNLYVLKKTKNNDNGIKGNPYFYKTENDTLVSQARMSTGENLLISILNSLFILYKKRTSNNDGRPCIVFLDEIELALHSSALRRLIFFLNHISKELNLAVFFSTHSIELLREIPAQNLYYLQNNIDGSIQITNPCYPGFATRNLYSDDGYGNDLIVLVEDDLAKLIIERVLIEEQLMTSIRIKILPTGGWTNTIIMAYDITSSNLILKCTKLAVILDKDIENEVPKFIRNNKQYSGVKYDFLPMKSLEKYLHYNLCVNNDPILFNLLDSYVFLKKPLKAVLENYKAKEDLMNDIDGKKLFGYLQGELNSMRKTREDMVEIVVKHILNDADSIKQLKQYLIDKIGS